MLETTLTAAGRAVPVTAVNTVVVGAGAAGMSCALHLVRFWRARGLDQPQDRVLVVTGGLALGASRMSGSDKQTYYKMGTSPRVGDTAEDFAATLTAAGCCHGDTALAEGVGSFRGFYNLVEAGVPFPHDRDGAFVGYKTDNDPCERATSAGPKTSRFMSQCLEAQVRRAGVRILDKLPVVRFLTAGDGDDRRIIGMASLDLSAESPDDSPPLRLFAATNWVLAAGGPGEVYATTVYPRGQVGIHAPALEAGLEACNLTESQYGLASIKFRWNVSGTYMQVVPRIYSTDPAGRDPREFLTEYFPDMPSMATNIFLKGYQWPFDAQRIVGGQSSLIDMAVHQETVVRGRRVWMDFLHNPVGPEGPGDSPRAGSPPGPKPAGSPADSAEPAGPAQPANAPGWDAFRIDALGPEAREYLERTGAVQATPIERLRHMNPPAIEIYAENGIDLSAEPLEIAVCAQHMNGGFAVDEWWRSNVPGVFVIGEMAGTHGVKRPGGAALNAGQVGALRAAEFIANARPADPPENGDRLLFRSSQAPTVPGSHAGAPGQSGAQGAQRKRCLSPFSAEALRAGAADVLAELDRLAAGAADAQTPAEALAELRDRMTRYGAHLRSRQGVRQALRDALAQFRRIERSGLRLENGDGLAFRGPAGPTSAEDDSRSRHEPDTRNAERKACLSPFSLHAAVVARQLCLMHVAILRAIDALFERGAGSRGSHCILESDAGPADALGASDAEPGSPRRQAGDPPAADASRAQEMHPALIDPATGRPYRFRSENEALRNEILTLRYDPAAESLFATRIDTPRPIPRRDIPFETAWAQYRAGAIYKP